MRILTVFLLLWAGAALADTSSPLFYTRATIAVMRKSPPQKTIPPLPWSKEQPVVVAEASNVGFDVEVRDGMTLYNQKGWFNLSSPSEKNGVLMVFAAPGQPPVIPMTQYAPLDILLIDGEGTIAQIIPNITLSELDRDIVPPSPVLAFLFLKGGSCQKLSINPGDVVDYKLFRRPPTVLSAPISPARREPAQDPVPPHGSQD